MKQGFSVCMSVYHGDNAVFFKDALDSVFSQTFLPNELVLVVDGTVGDNINQIINNFESDKKDIIKVIRLEKNSGHAVARQTGLNASTFDYVAIMDSDDIALPDRFEKQMLFIQQHPEVDALGGQIAEFINEPENIVGKRIVPYEDADIKNYLKNRCPMNLVTVMLKKDSVEKVGGYIDWYCEEDYYLWVRMFEANMIFANLPDVLVNVRTGKDMYARRGGWKYFKSEAMLQKYMYTNNIIGGAYFITNIAKRLIVQVLLPNKIRGWVFRNFARKK